MDILSIKIPPRTRKEFGDLKALAASINEVGLLHPIVIDGKNNLIAGERRLRAAALLGWKEVPTRIIAKLDDALLALSAERDENTCREPFRPTEAVAMGERLEKLLKPLAEKRREETQGRPKNGSKRTAGNLPAVSETRDAVGSAVGMSGKTYEAAKSVVEAAKLNPVLAPVVEEMDRTGNVNRAVTAIRQHKKLSTTPVKVETPGFPDGPFRCVVIDPPWPIKKIQFDRRPVEKESMDYPTLSLDEIKALPVNRLCNQDGTHVYLWVTHKFLPFGLELFEAWGVRYECLLTWNKRTAQPLWWRFTTEHCLFGKVASLSPLKKGEDVAFDAPQQKHSHKPEQFFDLVRRVSPEPRLTMFDGKREGFESWGMVHA